MAEGIKGKITLEPMGYDPECDDYDMIFTTEDGRRVKLTGIEDLVFGELPWTIPTNFEVKGKLTFEKEQ